MVGGFGVTDDNCRVGEQSVEHGMGPPFLGISNHVTGNAKVLSNGATVFE